MKGSTLADATDTARSQADSCSAGATAGAGVLGVPPEAEHVVVLRRFSPRALVTSWSGASRSSIALTRRMAPR